MYNILVVHVLDPLADLTHEDDASSLSQNKVIQDDSVEELSALDTKI